ncbi:hypothetical protein GGR54DRAFT_435992 [Hypoxylon sp. NC1633]|nr:hypothetical protein GGR54DRAFT_435992 [Hypoxylon sp. NC1633]
MRSRQSHISSKKQEKEKQKQKQPQRQPQQPQTRRQPTSLVTCQYTKNPMEDLRHAEATVAHFADHIERLRLVNLPVRNTEMLIASSSPTVERQGSNDSGGSMRKSSANWGGSSSSRSVGKDWAQSPTGALWLHISDTLEEVAREQGVNETALKEFIGSLEVLELGAEFVRAYRGCRANEKPHWAAEDLFFDLQTVKQGDASARRWTHARIERRMEWDLADHLARFVLSADSYRMKVDREDWNAWGTDFKSNISFYLGILRCFTLRDAEQRQAQDRNYSLGKNQSQSQNQNQNQNRDLSAQKQGKLTSNCSVSSRLSLSRHSSKTGST